MKIDLPEPPKAVGAYVPAIKTGNIIMTSGMLPTVDGVLHYKGKLGKDVSIEDGAKACKMALLNGLSAINALIGDLKRIKKIVRLNGYINSAPGFTDQSKVLNGASEFLIQSFGEIGRHSRIAIGVAELPLDAAVELDLTVEI